MFFPQDIQPLASMSCEYLSLQFNERVYFYPAVCSLIYPYSVKLPAPYPDSRLFPFLLIAVHKRIILPLTEFTFDRVTYILIHRLVKLFSLLSLKNHGLKPTSSYIFTTVMLLILKQSPKVTIANTLTSLSGFFTTFSLKSAT